MSKFLSGAAFRSGSRKKRRNLDVQQKQPEITQAIGFRDDDSPKVVRHDPRDHFAYPIN